MTKYLIHAVPERMWYVCDFMIPSMLEQGIAKNQINVWIDHKHTGNLASCLESFMKTSMILGETWHLQDDILLSKNFAEITEKYNTGVVCGYYNANLSLSQKQRGEERVGEQKANYMWYSFPCIHIPNNLAGEFVWWFNDVAKHTKKWQARIKKGKSDDFFFRQFMLDRHKNDTVINLSPNIVDHVDYLLGGSISNPNRTEEKSRSSLWTEYELNEELERKIQNRYNRSRKRTQ